MERATPPTVSRCGPGNAIPGGGIVVVPCGQRLPAAGTYVLRTVTLLDLNSRRRDVLLRASLGVPVATNCGVDDSDCCRRWQTEIDCMTATPVPVSPAVGGLVAALVSNHAAGP